MRQSRPDRYNRLPHAEEIPCAAFFGYSSCVMQRKPYGVMVSSTDQTQQVPFMSFLIIHYFERPASSVHLVKSIHLRALLQYWLIHELQHKSRNMRENLREKAPYMEYEVTIKFP